MEKEIILGVKKNSVKPKEEGNVRIFERNDVWVNRRKERLNKIRKRKDDMEMVDCTFKPKINNSIKYIKHSKMAYTSEFAQEGLENYFNRIKRAKKQRSYREINTKSRSRSKRKSKSRKKVKHRKIQYNDYQHGHTLPLDIDSQYSSELKQLEFGNDQIKKRESFDNIIENLKRINKYI